MNAIVRRILVAFLVVVALALQAPAAEVTPQQVRAALPELELAPGVEEALPVVEPAEELLPPVEEPPLTRAGVVKVPAKFFSPPDPPQPAIAATKTIDKNESTLCRIQPPLAVTGAVSRSSPSKGNYGCIYSGDIRGIP